MTKSLPVPLKSLDCLTVVENAYEGAVGAQVAWMTALSVTVLPGFSERLRSLMIPPAVETVPAKDGWVDVRLRLDGEMVTPAGTAMFAEPSAWGFARLVRVIFIVGEAPAQASAAASAGASSSGTAGTAATAALNSFL